MNSKNIILVIVCFFVVSSIIIGYHIKYNSGTITDILRSLPNGIVEAKTKNKCTKRIEKELEKHRIESILDSVAWNSVEYMLFFMGHGRSGTTLLAALLDAHPNIIVAREYNVGGKWTALSRDQQTKDYLFQALFSNSFEKSRRDLGRRDCPNIAHSNLVRNQWQGKFDKRIKVSQYTYINRVAKKGYSS